MCDASKFLRCLVEAAASRLCLQIKEHAAGAIRNVSRNQELEGDITRGGALAPLIDLMDHTNPKIQIQAAGSVRNLSISPGSKVTVVEQGALPVLCKLIKSGDLRLVEQAAIIFRHLSRNAENKIKIMATEGAKALVELLKPLTKADESLDAESKALKVKIQEQAAGVLRNLSTHNDNKVTQLVLYF